MTNSGSVSPTALPRVVIVGGGFAGVNAATALAKAPVHVTLIDRRVYNTFQPLLYQVATGGLNPGDVTHFLRSLRSRQQNLEIVHEHLMEIDPDARNVRLLDGQTIAYDYLVLANGVTTTYFGTPGAKEHAFAVYSRSQAIRIRDTLFTRLEQATQQGDRRKGLRVVVVGGGPTGVEMAGALAELRDQGLEPAYPELEGDAFKITLVQRSGELLKPFVPKLRRYAEQQLRRREVDLRFGAGVAEVFEDSVQLTDGSWLRADLTIWATGVAPHEEVRHWCLPLDRNDRIRVGADLQVEGMPGIFAAGDVAIAPQDLPQLAQPAIQGGAHIGRQIRRLLAGQPTEPFEYYDKGQLAVIGRRSAVGELPGIGHLPVLHSIPFLAKIPGFSRTIALTARPAWMVWLFVHIQSLLGTRNRLTTMVGLWARYGFPHHRKAVPIVGDVPAIRPSRAQRLRLTPEEQAAAAAAEASDRADEVITIATPAQSNAEVPTLPLAADTAQPAADTDTAQPAAPSTAEPA